MRDSNRYSVNQILSRSYELVTGSIKKIECITVGTDLEQ